MERKKQLLVPSALVIIFAMGATWGANKSVGSSTGFKDTSLGFLLTRYRNWNCHKSSCFHDLCPWVHSSAPVILERGFAVLS